MDYVFIQRLSAKKFRRLTGVERETTEFEFVVIDATETPHANAPKKNRKTTILARKNGTRSSNKL